MDTQNNKPLQQGAIDKSFADNGVYTFGDRFIREVHGVTALPNNQLLISGTYYPDSYALARLNENGTLDNDFGDSNTGVAHRYFLQQHHSHGVSSVVLADGRILLSGVYRIVPDEFSAAITRLSSTGDVEFTFGINGVTTISAPAPVASPTQFQKGGGADPWAVRTSCTLTPLDDGGIIFSKTFTNVYRPNESYSIIGRLTQRGDMDETFHGRGYTYLKPELHNIADNHWVQADGKLLVAGHLTGDQTAYLARFDKDGYVDSSFGNNGYLVFAESLESGGYVTALVPHSKDKFLLIANSPVNFPTNNGLIRSLNADGSPDQLFNHGLVLPAVLPGLGNTVEWRTAVEDDDGFIVLGYADRIVLARYLKTGELDPYFGENGGWTAIQATRTAEDLARQEDGKIVVVGQNAQGESIAMRFMGTPRTTRPDQGTSTRTVFSAFNRFFETLRKR